MENYNETYKKNEINRNLNYIYEKLDKVSKLLNTHSKINYNTNNDVKRAGITRNENNLASKQWVSSLRNPFSK
jgi:hypothetical protein